MGNTKSGTLGKLSRRVRRNIQHALAARGKREKAQAQHNFKNGFNLGADMFKLRILNATAGYEYESTDTTPVQVDASVNVDDSSESTLGTDVLPAVEGVPVGGEVFPVPDPASDERWNSDTGRFEPASY